MASSSGGGHDDESAREAQRAVKFPFENKEPAYAGDWSDGPVREPWPANFGISCGNWGGDKSTATQQTYMLNDVNESPAHVILLQEAGPQLLHSLKEGLGDIPQAKCVRYT